MLPNLQLLVLPVLGLVSISAFTSFPLLKGRHSFGKSNSFSCTSSTLHAITVPLHTGTSFVEKETSEEQKSVAPEDQWIVDLDYEGFGREVTALGKEIQALGGEADVKHLQKIVSWRNACAIVGLATVWMTPNPLTILALSSWTYASWTMIAHHTCHGGYNRHSDANGKNSFNSRGFALGSVLQRCRDWLDWMAPEAWNVEHNRLHHYRLNELSDPDLVQRNMGIVRDSAAPMMVKYMVSASLLPIWKWFYYAPNTFKELQISRWKQEGRELPAAFDAQASISVLSLISEGPKYKALREVVKPLQFVLQVLGPFLFTRFVLVPLPFLFVPGMGPMLWGNAMWNVLLAELLTNIHAYITIVTNHAGSDLYTFDDAVKPKSPSFYVRQIVGSANYVTNNDDITDFSHGFLNYQIEHRKFFPGKVPSVEYIHSLKLTILFRYVDVWPDLSMRQYQLAAPRLRAICEKYNVPYVQESVWTRLRKTTDIMVGKSTMRVFPTEHEPAKDKTALVTWKTTDGAIDDEA
jgi:Fatty acid desaturase